MKLTRTVSCILVLSLMGGCYSVAQSMVERGYRWIRRGETDKALSTFDATIKKYPKNVLAYTGRADALFEARRDREAITSYSQAIALLDEAKPKSVVGTRGEAEVIGERFLSYQNQGLAFPFGLEPYLYLRRGGAYHGLTVTPSGVARDSFAKALADYERAITLAPDYTAAREARTRLLKEEKEPNLENSVERSRHRTLDEQARGK